MPGLSQLKQFSSDLLALGDEINSRASRGEQPLKIEIPQSVEDVNDSEDFVLGMPEIEAVVEDDVIDDDLSDLAGLSTSSSGEAEGGDESSVAPAFEAPDMSGLLNPLEGGEFGGADMPDLSMFSDEPEAEPEEIIEEEPEEVSIADMNLEDLLSGGGFDQPEGEEDNFNLDLGEDNTDNVTNEPEASLEPLKASNIIDDLGAFDNDDDINDIDSLDEIDDVDEIDNFEIPTDSSDSGEALPIENLDFVPPDEEEINEPNPFDDFAAFKAAEEPVSAEPIEEPIEEAPVLEDINLEEPVAESSDIEEPIAVESGAEEPEIEALSDEDFNLPEDDLSDVPVMEDIPEFEDLPESSDNFDLPEDLPEIDDFAEPAAEDLENPIIDNMEEPSTEGIAEPVADELGEQPSDSFDIPESGEELNNLDNIDDLGDLGDLGDLDLPDMNLDSSNEVDEFSSAMPEGLFDANDVEFNAKDDIPEYEDFSMDGSSDLSESSEDSDAEESEEPLEIFDTSEMEGLDFDIPDTDTQLSKSADDDSQYDLKSDDDMAFGAEFEIPGFSDVETVKEQKSGKLNLSKEKDKKHKAKKRPEDEAELDEKEEELPPNTLSDRQYKIFKKNLSEYPLNVRLAFEDFLVQDEFTDDAEFEVIEKILNKAPARQVASTLEKMLDISIPVPRDFEHRSAEEYEEYKKSISYQLKNKIIPAALVFIVGIFVCIGLFNFGKNCIYKPLRANSLYKQGYVLLQESEYPLSEIKFNQATNYRLSKKWFFEYARGYREHKQYQRAAKMYQNILNCFKHDKNAGLEYADMELEDLANYERAEEIVRREVLDYHINDADGILKLGDVFLEWGTEKDPSKLEQAREQYATLLQLYGQNDLYLSRMMRYFIRTDNLREVLQLKQTFEPREKSLGSEDWTELSGYLLDKYYGQLAPSEEYLRYEIEGLRGLLLRAVQSDPNNPIALYNLARYFINTNENENIESTLQDSIEKFNAAKKMKSRDIYKYIDSYRLLGEHYIETEDFLQAQEQFAEGISLYITERDNAGFKGTPKIGKLYEDMGDLKYTISGDYDDALLNYTHSVNLENDSPKIRYRIGYIQYNKKNYAEALGSFMKAGDGNIKERNLLLAMANTLSLRGDDYAAEGYYDQLIETLDSEIAERGLVLPQASVKDYDVVNTYLSAANNYGVTLYRLAKKTGDSGKNAEAIVQFSQSVRAWDALTRNQETMVRLPGSNLAEQNIKYITHPIPEFEPAIYTKISKVLLDNEKL